MSTPLWFVSIIRRTFPFSRAAARLTRLPLVGRAAGWMLFDGDDIMLLPRTVAVTEDIMDGPQEVVPWQVLEHFVERGSFMWVMDECICRRSMKCKDYPVDLGCLFIGEAARKINPALGRQVSKQEALEHLARCREAGLFHLVGKNKLDAVWLNVRPGEKLLTICSCCTCCCLWRFLPDLSASLASVLERMPGLEIKVTEDCVGCETCLEAKCLAGAVSVVDGRAVISGDCRGCGRCVELCPNGAITMTFEGVDDPLAGAIERLENKVDVS